MQNLKLAYIQTKLHWEDTKANLRHFDRLFKQFKQKNDLIVLPETFTTGFPVDPQIFAQPISGEAMEWMHEKAKQQNAVVCGSMLMKREGFFYNTFVWMRPDGSYELYDKGHVFRMGGEDEQIKPGLELLTVELRGWKIRPLICYDLRFPVWSHNSYKNGQWEYDMLIYVANWPAVRAHPWKQLLIARAIENQAIVLGVNRVGQDGLGNSYTGDSCLLDAKGQYLSQAFASKEMIIETVLKPEPIMDFRHKFNVGLDWDRFNIIHLSPDKM